MKHTRVEEHVNSKIRQELANGVKLEGIIDFLKLKVENFASKETYIDVSLNHLLTNWEKINNKVRYTTYYAIYCNKRLQDIQWLIDNKNRFNNFSDDKLFELYQFKERLKNKNNHRVKPF